MKFGSRCSAEEALLVPEFRSAGVTSSGSSQIRAWCEAAVLLRHGVRQEVLLSPRQRRFSAPSWPARFANRFAFAGMTRSRKRHHPRLRDRCLAA